MKTLAFNEDGLIPVIVQDHQTREVLMMAYMNIKSLKQTIRTGETTFYSRSRKALWHKGATSGNKQRVKEIRVDCDLDTLLVRVEPKGPACHTGAVSCFFRSLENSRMKKVRQPEAMADILNQIYTVILDRKKRKPKGSYVASLMKSGRDKILKKIGEEASEVIISATQKKKSDIVWEVADLWFHTLVMMGYHGIKPEDIYRELGRRFSPLPTNRKRGSRQ